MTAKPQPVTILDHVTQKLDALPVAARLAVVFDPYADLALADKLTTSGAGRVWHVLRYDGNDLAFRRQWAHGDDRSDLIWVTCTPGMARDGAPRIDLRSMFDIWQRAEDWIDASLPGVLRELAPKEIWPKEPVWDLAPILSRSLLEVIDGLRKLRLHIGKQTALDERAIRALALHVLQPAQPIEQFLLKADTSIGILESYLELLWSTDWQDEGLSLLQTQARRAPHPELANVAPWFEIPAQTLALYLYLRRALGQHHIPNIANQLRGLGLLDVDTGRLETHVGSVLARWDRAPNWHQQIIRQAEATLAADDAAIDRIIDLLDLKTPEDSLRALERAETPAMIYALQRDFFERAFRQQRLADYTPAWADRRPAALRTLVDTSFAARATRLAELFDELAFIDARRGLTPPAGADIARLLDWYVTNQLYDLEYAHVRAAHLARPLSKEQIGQQIKRYLDTQRQHIKAYLDQLDHELAVLITTGWRGYIGHPRLAINLLPNMTRHLRPSAQARLWVVVFDGMRWDTWARHVKPRLLEHFEFVDVEKPYLSLLPSWTRIARTGLLAGAVPALWMGYDNRPTQDQSHLASKMFRLPRSDRSRLLQFYAGAESDRTSDQIQSGYPYNVLVYNISDDNLHSLRGNLLDLNRVVNTLLDDILQTLSNLIGPEDTLVISSDHGFVELDPNDAAEVDYDPQAIRYRYINGSAAPTNSSDSFKVEYPGFNSRFTVAVGRHWFRRMMNRGPEDRYAHGGLSFAEMTVPGAILKRITTPRIELHLTIQPSSKLELIEGATADLVITVTNKGNRPLVGEITAQADAGAEPAVYQITLAPGEQKQTIYRLIAHYHKRADRTIEATTGVRITVNYTGIDGKPKARRHAVAVDVTPRTDTVELDFGGLPDIDF
jgi:hypothetical protein